MITGSITNLRPHVELLVSGAGGQGKVEFTLDTGYTGTLTLSTAACVALKLQIVNNIPSYLADGSEIWLDIYLLEAEWDGINRKVEVIALDSEPLLGMTMLEGYDVLMSVKENGIVRIQKSA